MAHADMAEGVEHAFVRQHAVGERELIADVGQIIGHWDVSCWSGTCRGDEQSRNVPDCQAAALALEPCQEAKMSADSLAAGSNVFCGEPVPTRRKTLWIGDRTP